MEVYAGAIHPDGSDFAFVDPHVPDGTPEGARKMRQDGKLIVRTVVATFAAVAVAVGAFLFEAG